MPSRSVAAAHPISLPLTLGPLVRGLADPTMRVSPREVVRASRTPEGPVSVRFVPVDGRVDVEAWGPGARWLLDRADAWCGALDDDDFDPPQGTLVREIWRRTPGLRIPRTGLLTERLIPVVLEQKVTGMEARRAYRRLTLALGEPAPGDLGLMLPPDPARMAELPYERYHPYGIERRRADLLRGLARRAATIDALVDLPVGAARARLGAIRGIGPWSVAEVARTALGDADAVSVGDFHLKHLVSWALAGEPRGTDERMLELLEPYRPHRGRVQLLLEAGHLRPPAFGPRTEPRAIERH